VVRRYNERFGVGGGEKPKAKAPPPKSTPKK